jgi:hypothetical protein
MLLQLSKAELNRLVYRAVRSGEEAADVCDLLARMLVIGPKLDADPDYLPEGCWSSNPICQFGCSGC